MDSLPTASTQSWFIVAAVAFSPVMVLFLADAIGWLFRQARGKGGVTTVVNTQTGSANEQWLGLDRAGTAIVCLRPAKPVLAFVMVVAAEMLTDFGDEGGRDRH